MSWLTRNGKSYYYRNERRDGKVVSVYRGTGAAGNLAERADLAASARLAKARLELEAEQAVIQEMERVADQFEFVVRTLTQVCLLAAGYRKHKGQWRLKRDKAIHAGDPSAEGMERRAIE